MSSPAFFDEPDGFARREALDPRRSFIVQAPAGSGKTELLTQRYLRLLALVDQPESIIAITFTRKAAGEMRGRVLDALKAATDADAPINATAPKTADTLPAVKDHERRTRELAVAALARDKEMGWDLPRNPGRLRIQTIDALCMSIAGAMPWLARLGALPSVEDDTKPLYREAAYRTLLALGGDEEHAAPVAALLRHMDNDAVAVRDSLAAMLASRDQWLALAAQTDDQERGLLEEAMSRALARETGAVDLLVPPELREIWLRVARASTNLNSANWPALDDRSAWVALADSVLTKNDGTFRKRFGSAVNAEGPTLVMQLDGIPGLREALKLLRKLPAGRFTEEQWSVMRALLAVLKLAVAKLHEVFRETNTIDFTEIGVAARRALGPPDRPEDLAYRLDFRIQHMLVDEFQDTSRGQFELLERLTMGWEPEDRRTLFLVGDPMQSIYRFRQAEVGLFLQVAANGLGSLRPESLKLTANYRTEAALHDRMRAIFQGMFRDVREDARMGAISFTPSVAAGAGRTAEVTGESFTFDAFRKDDKQGEANRVIELIRAARDRVPGGATAILVRARTHLPAIVAALKETGEPFQAQDIDVLDERSVVQDLRALTRAMLHPGDRISWLAILRAPWCGLTLIDLETLVSGRHKLPVWEALADTRTLSEDGQRRTARLHSVLAEAFAEQGRWPLRRWVERAWIGLGGPACLSDDVSALQNAAGFFDLLEREQAGPDLPDFDRFADRMKQLFARPQPYVPLDASLHKAPPLQVMTIHKAKGLEFDTVILPGLGRREKLDDEPLFCFDEWQEDGRVERLLAPKPAADEDKNGIYAYLRRIDAEKSRHERVRQFYVAATRAKKRLHLLAQVDPGRDGKPQLQGMLVDLWPALQEEDRSKLSGAPAGAEPAARRPGVLRRLADTWTMPVMPAPAHWEVAVTPPEEPHEPSFEWVSESLRLAGTVVHAYLQKLALGSAIPDAQAIRAALIHAGVTRTELNKTAQRVARALEQTRTSARAQWILAPHQDAQSEYAIAGIVDGQLVRGTVDRTFIENGTRWIVDFKTSEHQGANLEVFLDEQQRRYRDQMTRYARLLEPLGLPVRAALYFPLLDEWRET